MRGLRLTTALTFTTLLCVAGSMVKPEPAHAYHSALYREAVQATNVRGLVKAIDGTYYGRAEELKYNVGGANAAAARAQGIRTGLYTVRLGSKMLPAVRTLGAVGLGVGAFDLGWKIGRTIDTKWLHLSAVDMGVAVTTGRIRDTQPMEWNFDAPSSTWRLRVYSDYGAPCGYTDLYTTSTVAITGLFGTDRTACEAFLQDASNAVLTSKPSWATTTVVACGSSVFGGTATFNGTCYRLTRTEAEMQSYLAGRVDTFTDWTTQTETRQMTTTGYDPAYAAQGYASQAVQDEAANVVLDTEHDAGAVVNFTLDPTTQPDPSIDAAAMPSCAGLTEADCRAALTAAGHYGTITVGTATFEQADLAYTASAVVVTSPAAGAPLETGAAVTITVNPSAMPLALPAPLPTETYAAYIARLQALGWVGAATVTTLSEAAGVPELGPDAPVTVSIPAISVTGPQLLRLPGGWPATVPRIELGTGLTFTKNPSTYAPVPPSSVPPAIDDGGGASIDFTPITGIDFGCKFPYGLVCYALQVTAIFDVTPDAPSWTFFGSSDPLTVTSAAGSWSVAEPYVVDLNILDPYMAIVRTILSVAIWVGAVWYLAANLLGLRSAGDPGAAIDDADWT